MRLLKDRYELLLWMTLLVYVGKGGLSILKLLSVAVQVEIVAVQSLVLHQSRKAK